MNRKNLLTALPMSNQSSWSVDAIGRFLHHSPQTKTLTSVKKLHAYLLTTGLLLLSPSVQAKLIFSYTACVPRTNLQILTNLCKFLIPNRDPVPFNILISQFARNGFAPYALKTFSFMHFSGVHLDSYALCSTLTASSDGEGVIFGRQVHALVVRSGWSSSVFVNGALIDLYAKSSLVDDAAQLFDEIPVKNTVCANALLSGYIDAKMWSEGLKVARNMPLLNINHDHFTLSAMLRASTGLSAVELGRQVHGRLVRTVYDSENDLFLQSSVIEMYGKCGFVEKACQVFALAGYGGEGENDLVLWTSMLDAYGTNGCYGKVIELYKEMLVKGIKPDEVAFVTVIAACARTGQVALGIEFFESIRNEYNVKPTQEHYSCLVDLLSRAGELDRAWKLLDEMLQKGFGGTDSMWGALLNACLDSGNIELGKLAAQRALEWDPQNVGIYILLSNLYARFGMWDQIGLLRELMKERGLKKDTGCSWIEVAN
ncbi:putative pentatricopeptide repeat-containing protein At3g23330 isoform X1 [Syzygium oleosum]|uniref:putative pentatricopeptide repeat-containing protein At3g23330 isoform X1 n=1 Tax=Syzygium oleosum TaxID=219896 RepID=UPI0024B8965E|nr:putative pentatricopeptide repeat-containing protein At3g23330 isoform X1 [Syzygium oleosum]